MSNYEILMQQMTPERMAELGVKLVNVDNRRLFYMTSSGQLYPMDEYQNALQHEYNWLTFKESQDEVGEPDVAEEETVTQSPEE